MWNLLEFTGIIAVIVITVTFVMLSLTAIVALRRWSKNIDRLKAEVVDTMARTTGTPSLPPRIVGRQFRGN